MLENAERRLTAIRLDELLRRRVRGDFDFAHLKAIHFYFSGLVYLGRAAEKDQHCQRGYVLRDNVYRRYGERNLHWLEKENHLAGLNRADYVKRMAFYFGEINALHPFREGNGRTQREFFRELAKANRYQLSYSFSLFSLKSRLSFALYHYPNKVTSQHSSHEQAKTLSFSAVTERISSKDTMLRPMAMV